MHSCKGYTIKIRGRVLWMISKKIAISKISDILVRELSRVSQVTLSTNKTPGIRHYR